MNPANEPESAAATPAKDTLPPDIDEASDAVAASELAHPDPITGEPGAHPVGVGVGALSAGAAGAAIGALGGPIGMIVGAAIGAVAGGLAGHEVAATTGVPAEGTVANATDEEPSSATPGDGPKLPPVIPNDPYGAPGGSALNPAVFAAFGGQPQDAGMLSTGTTQLSPRPVQGTMGTTGTTSEGGLTASGTAGLSPEVAKEVEDDALPTPTHAAVPGATTGFQAPVVSGESDLVGAGEERVRLAAFYIFLERSRTGEAGDALGDWLEAERSLA